MVRTYPLGSTRPPRRVEGLLAIVRRLESEITVESRATREGQRVRVVIPRPFAATA